MNQDAACPFCDLDPARIVAQCPLTITLRDSFPVSPGHTLIVTKRHIANFFDATQDEHAAILAAVICAKADLDRIRPADGYNVGANAGEAAGQTVMHLHVHLIPRFTGDTPAPRGGVRHCIPGKGDYG